MRQKRSAAILQAETTECGVVCLAIIAAHYGLNLSLQQLRQRFPQSLKGVNLSGLIQIGNTLGLKCRPLRLELEQLNLLKLPCILHWDLNHFVVLTSVGSKGATIMDPAFGERTLSWSEISTHFTGVALELSPSAEFRPQVAEPSVSISQLTGKVDGIWRGLLLIFLLSVALQVFVVLGPFLMQWIVDQVLVSADRDLLTVLGIAFGLVLLLQVGIGLLRGWAVVYLSSSIGLQWTSNVFMHLIKLPLDYFEKRHLGDITLRMASVQSIQRTLTTSFVEAFIDGLMVVVTLVLMLIYSWKLTLVSVFAAALYLFLRVVAFRSFRDGTERQLMAASRQQSHLLESIRGVQSIKIAGRESMRSSNYLNLMHQAVDCDVWVARLGLIFSSTSQLIMGIERVAVIWIGALLALQNIFSVGMLIAFLAYKDQFSGRISSLIDKWIEFRMLRLHGERLADIVLTPPDEDDAYRELPATVNARIVVDKLSFRYAASEPWVIKDCSFTVEDGESVAIIGESGCGKTTLIKLLLGLLQPVEGSISFDGVDIRKMGARNYRSNIGAVMQDDQLFAGSVADNINFFDNHAEQKHVEDVARLAAVHDEISAMPMGYDSLIGDMGSSLSGGQKQRVILARALYRNPKLLLLDEATSHLDVMKERMVNDAVRQLRLTKIIVAHRPETIASADRVLEMKGGKIVDEREHRDLPHSETSVAFA